MSWSDFIISNPISNIPKFNLKKVGSVSLRNFEPLITYVMETYHGETLNSVKFDTINLFVQNKSNNLYVYPTLPLAWYLYLSLEFRCSFLHCRIAIRGKVTMRVKLPCSILPINIFFGDKKTWYF